MKNDLEYFRKFSIIDYSLNLKKFREYLEYCRKNELVDEKKFILESLVNYTNEKSISNTSNINDILNEFTNLCVLTVIYSDFEIENFFKIPNFSFNFQKIILIESINYCLDRLNENHDYIYLKFQFWVLKLMNKNISATSNFNPIAPISKEELNQSLESLTKKIINEKFEDLSIIMKTLLLKISYELGYYHYLNNNKLVFQYFNFCINKSDSLSLNNKYFETNDLKKMLYLLEQEPHWLSDQTDFKNDIEMSNQISSDNFFNVSYKENDFATLFQKISLNPQDKIIIERFSIDDMKTFELFNIWELLKYSKNLLFLAFNDFNRLKDALLYINKVNEVINIKLLSNDVEYDNKELLLAEKENRYHQVLITTIESIYKKDEKLSKNFLKDLSSTILKYTLTDDLEISGMIHGLIINFTQSFGSIINYFRDFVEFFQNTQATIEKVNQIFFINCILEMFNIILYLNTQNNIVIEGDRHYNLFNLIFFWLNNFKKGKTLKNENIMFILIKTIKNLDFLLVLKIIYIGILKFIIEKKKLVDEQSDDIFIQLDISSELFNIESIINENKTNLKLKDVTIIFKEDKSRIYNFDALNLESFEKTLFDLVYKCEKKILEYSKFSELEYLERRINLLFFRNKSNNYSTDNIVEEYIKYLKCFFENYKIKFYKTDLISDLKKTNELYAEFKNMLNEIHLFRLIYILYKKELYLEASIFLQYTRKIDYDLVYKILKKNSETHNIEKLQYIWKITYFELLANLYHNMNKLDHLAIVSDLIKRISNHQYFKKNPLRKIFKIINFIKFIDKI